MSLLMTQKGRSAAYRGVAIQFVVVLLVSVIGLYWGFKVSASLFAGGMISVIPSLLFVYKVFQHSGAQASRQVLQGFYKGEALKFFLAIVLFIVVLNWLPVSAAASLIGFVIAVIVQMIVPFIVKAT